MYVCASICTAHSSKHVRTNVNAPDLASFPGLPPSHITSRGKGGGNKATSDAFTFVHTHWHERTVHIHAHTCVVPLPTPTLFCRT